MSVPVRHAHDGTVVDDADSIVGSHDVGTVASARPGGPDRPGFDDWPESVAPGSPTPSPRRALLQLAMAVAAIVFVAAVTHSLALLIVIASIIVIVMVHELGHFATAKWSGMKVTEYFVGFGPRIWSVRRGETEYGVKAIPAGGYVKIIGMSNLEEVDPADEPRTYRQKPFHNRVIVATAGSFMHFLMAFLLIWAAFVFIGQTQPGSLQVQGFAPIHGQDPARSAGLRAGDVIVSANGRAIHDANQLHDAVSVAGRPVTLVVERDGTRRTVTATPVADKSTASGTAQGYIGVDIAPALAKVNPLRALGTAGSGFGTQFAATIASLGHTFSPHGLGSIFSQVGNSQAAQSASQDNSRPESIVGAVRTATQGAEAGPIFLIWILVELNLAFGILNLFPMLPLDGGHVAVAVYERIRSRRNRQYHADVAKLAPVAYTFVAFLLVFVGTLLFLDVAHPAANPFQ
jgi:membrane-associated protease RseP (regulator of RpoE activity)